MIEFQQFCDHLDLAAASEIEKAKAFIWFHFHSSGINGCDISGIARYFTDAHFANPNRARLSSRLSADSEVATRRTARSQMFSLNRSALKRIEERTQDLQDHSEDKVLTPLAAKLSAAISPIKSIQVSHFLAEAIGCLDGGFLRAAVVLSWQGALAVLQEQTLANHLSDFNSAAAERGLIKKNITSLEHFQRIQEFDQLICFEAAGVISKAVKVSLNDCLTRRNNCGHPNDFVIGEAQVAGHLETLIVHVFQKFS